MEIGSPQVVNQVVKRSEQIVHSVLDSHHAHVTDNRDALLAQPRMGIDGTQPTQIRPRSHNRDSIFPHTAAQHLDKFVRLVRGDDQISRPAGELLEEHQRLMDKPVTSASQASQVHLGSKIVLIEHEPLPKQLVEKGYQDKRIGRIVSMKDIKSLANPDPQREQERRQHRTAVLPKVSPETTSPSRRTVSIHLYAPDALPSKLSRCGRTNHGYAITCDRKRGGFELHTSVLGVGTVLQEHEDASLG